MIFAAALAAARCFSGEVALRPDGVLLRNGQPFFPFGVYHVSWAGDAERRLADMREIAAAGFNVMHAAISGEDRVFLDEAQRLAIAILAEVDDPDGTTEVASKFKDHPAIFAWLAADDADNGKRRPEEVAAIHHELLAVSPRRFTYISCGYPQRFGAFMDAASLVGIQTYPVANEPLSSTDYVLSAAFRAGSAAQRPIIANLQAFAWKDQRAPTPVEIRNMTYQALINGVRGILYYTYFDQTWDMRQHPLLWAEMKRLAAEIRILTPFVLNGKRSKLNTGGDDLIAGQWMNGDRAIIVVVNTTEATKTVSLDLPQPLVGLQPLFPDRTARLQIRDDLLAGQIPPAETCLMIATWEK